MDQITEIFSKIEAGDESAVAKLLPIVYDELKRIAAAKMARESPGQTLQTTALVHEAWMRLSGTGTPSNGETPANSSTAFRSRGHFFAAAAESMRRILIDNARRRNCLKRGGDRERVGFDKIEPPGDDSPVDLIALDEVLTRLEAHDADKAAVVKLRYFAGLTIEENRQRTRRLRTNSEATLDLRQGLAAPRIGRVIQTLSRRRSPRLFMRMTDSAVSCF